MTSVSQDGWVEFRFYRPNVQQVNVVGDFNGWCRDALPMSCSGDGWWRARARLHGGDYRFRYLADGAWYTDYASNGIDIEVGKPGLNSLLSVPGTEQSEEDARQVA